MDASLLDCLERMLPYGLRSEDGMARALSLDPSMALHGEYSTLQISECPNDAVASSLSDILETGDVPRKYYLSPKACAGILRRASKRGKDLPPQLQKALEQVCSPCEKDVMGGGRGL